MANPGESNVPSGNRPAKRRATGVRAVFPEWTRPRRSTAVGSSEDTDNSRSRKKRHRTQTPTEAGPESKRALAVAWDADECDVCKQQVTNGAYHCARCRVPVYCSQNCVNQDRVSHASECVTFCNRTQPRESGSCYIHCMCNDSRTRMTSLLPRKAWDRRACRNVCFLANIIGQTHLAPLDRFELVRRLALEGTGYTRPRDVIATVFRLLAERGLDWAQAADNGMTAVDHLLTQIPVDVMRSAEVTIMPLDHLASLVLHTLDEHGCRVTRPPPRDVSRLWLARSGVRSGSSSSNAGPTFLGLPAPTPLFSEEDWARVFDHGDSDVRSSSDRTPQDTSSGASDEDGWAERILRARRHTILQRTSRGTSVETDRPRRPIRSSTELPSAEHGTDTGPFSFSLSWHPSPSSTLTDTRLVSANDFWLGAHTFPFSPTATPPSFLTLPSATQSRPGRMALSSTSSVSPPPPPRPSGKCGDCQVTSPPGEMACATQPLCSACHKKKERGDKCACCRECEICIDTVPKTQFQFMGCMAHQTCRSCYHNLIATSALNHSIRCPTCRENTPVPSDEWAAHWKPSEDDSALSFFLGTLLQAAMSGDTLPNESFLHLNR